jgi:type II secretory pathway pseudopilin PulG
MGILMMVAIPSVSRTIENSRRDTFANVAHEYVNAVRNNFIADNIECQTSPGGSTYTIASALPVGDYYYVIATAASTSANTPFDSSTYVTSTGDLMESGGKSSFGNTEVYGYVHIKKEVNSTTGKSKLAYTAAIVDASGHGFETEQNENNIKRSNINVSGMNYANLTNNSGKALNGKKLCKLN